MKKLVMMALFGGTVLGCQFWDPCTMTDGFFFDDTVASMKDAIIKNDIESLKNLLSKEVSLIFDGLSLVAEIRDPKIFVVVVDYAIEQGYTESVKIIKEIAEQPEINYIHARIDQENLISDILISCSYLAPSHWFKSKLPEFIAYAEKEGKTETAQFLKEFQAQHQNTDPK